MSSRETGKLSIFVAVLILVAGISVSGFIFLKTKTGSASISQQIGYLIGNKNQNANQSNQNKDLDSDHDGLPDWQEKTYGTDPKNPDTDGDGYLDGEEVSSGYDPLKKAPDDALPNAKNPRPLYQNLTKALSQQLGQQLILGNVPTFNRDTGEPLTAEELANNPTLNQALDNAISQGAEDLLMPVISDQEIKISPTIGKNENAAYAAALKKSITAKLIDPAEVQAILMAIKNNDPSNLEQIKNTYLDSYQKVKEITVPSNLANFHKGILAIFLWNANIDNAIINATQDPLKAVIALAQYQKMLEQLKNVLTQLANTVANTK